MLPLNLIPTNLLTYVKAGAIIIAIATTNYLTWQYAQSSINKERLENAQQALMQEKSNTAYWLNQVDGMRLQAIKAQELNSSLDKKINIILKEHRNAPPLPTNCVLDASGVLSLEQARANAISTATDKPDN